MAEFLRVLIIEDSEDDTLLLLRYLQVNGIEPTYQRVDTYEALDAALNEADWDIVFCDYALPTLSPIEAVRRVRRYDEHVPLIIVTAYVGKPELVQLVKLGAQDIVLKDNLARLKPVIERQLAEAQLRQEKMNADARLISAIESISEGMALFDAEDRLTIYNRRYRTMLDKCAHLIMPQIPFEDLLRCAASHGQFEDIPDDVEKFIQKRLVMRRKPGKPFELKFCGDRWIRIEDRLTSDGGVITVLTDISERKKLDMMKNEFISIVGHELRTPLTSVKGSLALLESGTAGTLPDEARTMVSIAHKNSDRLVRLINDILDLQKIELGKMHFEFSQVAVQPLLEEAVSANQSYAKEFGVRLTMLPTQDNITVRASYDRLMQVLANLLSNAIKFSHSGSTVTLGARQNGNLIRISVADQGIGIPDNFHDRIFQKFSQADATDTRRKGGSGLGLSIIKAIVESHGGQIGFDSAEGKGTTFHFDLPVWCPEPDKPVAESTSQQNPNDPFNNDDTQIGTPP